MSVVTLWIILFGLFTQSECLIRTQATNNFTLLFNTYNHIYSINTAFRYGNQTLDINPILRGRVGKSVAFDYHLKNNLICWSDEDQGSIECAEITSNKSTKIINSGLEKPDGIAIDWNTDKIYWTDGEMMRIEVISLDKRYRKVLFWLDLDQPRAIALIPHKQFMIWTDWGESPKIEQASMDGDPASRIVLIDKDIYWPNGITVDLKNELIYWVDGKLLFIDVMDLNGGNRKRVVKNLDYPQSVTFSNNRLYWTDWKLIEILSFDIESASKLPSIKSPDVPIVVRAYDSSVQPYQNNPCNSNNGNCSHLCLLSTNIKGFSCACPTGIKLITESQCADGPQEMLFLVQRTQISRISLDTLDFTSFALPLEKIKYAIAIDFDPVEQFLYWTDAEIKAIRRGRMDGSGQMDIATTEVGNPDGLAIDYMARNVYWTDPIKDRIEVCRLDGSSRKVIIHDDLEDPRAIALAPTLGWMFWSDWHGVRPKIERANLDGTERVVLISDNLGWPNGIALDIESQKMYWCDARKHKIEEIGMDGSGRREVLGNNLAHVFGLSLLGDYLYWTDWQRRSIERANKLTGANRLVVVDQFPDVMGLKVTKLNEINGTSRCAIDNGGCSNLCFNRHQDYVCRCPIDQELRKDKKTCFTPDAFLLFSRHWQERKTKVIARISLDFNDDNHNHNVIPFKNVLDLHGLDMHVKDKRIYWTTQKKKSVMRAFINGSDIQKVVENLIQPEGIAVDWIANNIFWTDSEANRIEVARLDGTSRRILLWKGITEPKHIVLEPKKGYMYWTELAPDSIRRALMDGSDIKTIINPANHPTGLTIDPETRRLYWACEAKRGVIESADWDGKSIAKPISLSDDHVINAVTIYEEFLYWSDYTTGDLMRANKTNGQNKTLIHTGLEYMDNLLAFNPSRQRGTNQCSTNNGGCQHLCLALPAPRSMTCACPTHFKLAPDNTTCIPPKNFFIFSQKTTFGRLMPNSVDSPDAPLPVSENGKNIRAIEYDPVSQFIYWIEAKSHHIKMNNLTHSLVFIDNGPDPFDLALDPVGRILYWTCAQSNTINVTSLSLDDIAVNVDAIDIGDSKRPRYIALHAFKRFLFWTDTESQQAIYRAGMDGSNAIILQQNLKGVGALTVDYHRDLIFFAIESESIDYMDLNGSKRKSLVKTHIHQVVSIASLDGFVYWIDEGGKTERVTSDGKVRRPDLQRSNVTDIIAVWTPDQKSLQNHPCSSGVLKCSRICIATQTPNRYGCSCPKGFMLMDDKRNCGAVPACGPDHFTCQTGVNRDCIPAAWRCDGQDDCPDKSDEVGCPKCRHNEFKCQSGECIAENLSCDGTTNCGDGSDEVDCCKPLQHFQCPGNKVCIPLSQICDGWDHCADSGDESPELCRSNNQNVIAQSSNKKNFIIIIVVVMLVLFFGAYILQIWKTKLSRNSDEPKDDQAGAPLSPGGNKNTRITELATTADAIRMSTLNSRSSMNSYDRNHITGASSSTTNGSSLKLYPLNPPPSPATTAASMRYSGYRPYRHYKTINQPPPPTPCSTDVCDESDSIYTAKSHHQHLHHHHHYNKSQNGDSGGTQSGSSGSKSRYRYEAEPYPPPPTPRSHYHSDMPESCPPSPSSRSSTYFAPLPPPPSPDHYSSTKGYS